MSLVRRLQISTIQFPWTLYAKASLMPNPATATGFAQVIGNERFCQRCRWPPGEQRGVAR